MEHFRDFSKGHQHEIDYYSPSHGIRQRRLAGGFHRVASTPTFLDEIHHSEVFLVLPNFEPGGDPLELSAEYGASPQDQAQGRVEAIEDG
jgi:hypothetical protein